MREEHNIIEAAALGPDMMGFIFYPQSPRYAGEILNKQLLKKLPSYIKKAGVFVDEDIETIKFISGKYSLDVVQLHGNEKPGVCRELKEAGYVVIKSFNIKCCSDLKLCGDYQNDTDYFLFDSSSHLFGGSGLKFDWDMLIQYNLKHPFILSGGIGTEDTDKILKISNPAFCGVDINSRFEVKPAIKDINKLKLFISDIRTKTK